MARLPANFSDLLAIRQERSTTLDAKIHDGYDATAEHKEQGNLLSSVQYGQGVQTSLMLGTALSSADNIILADNITPQAPAASTFSINNTAISQATTAPLIINNNDSVPSFIPVSNNFATASNGAAAASGNINGEQLAALNLSLPAAANDGASRTAQLAAQNFSALANGNVNASVRTSMPGVDDGKTMPDPTPPVVVDTTTDGGNNGGNTTPTPPTAPVIVAPPITGTEDQTTSLPIQITYQTGTDISTVIVIGGVPSGAILSAGTHNNDGTWTLTPAQLNGLTLTPAHDYNGTVALTITATTTATGGISATTMTTVPVVITSVADAPTLAVSTVTNLDHTVAVNIAAALVHPASSETLTITVSNLPSGTILSAGTHNNDGSWTLTPAQLAGLTLTPPANYNGDLGFTVTATAADGATSASTATNTHVTVVDAADAPTLSVQSASGNEDAAIALQINVTAVDSNPAEVLSITISGVPNNAILSAGIHNSDGTWTLTPAQLAGLTITPPHNYSGAFDLSVTATATENSTSAMISSPLHVTVAGVADTPTLSVQSASGSEDTAIPLTISAALTDLDNSETLRITIDGVPVGATLSHGTHNSDGSWSLTPGQLSGLTITPPANYNGAFDLSITATSSENSTEAHVSASLHVTVAGVADAPTLSVQTATGAEDSAIPIVINAAEIDTNGVLTLTLDGMPVGTILSAGTHNSDGSWTLTPAQLAGLTVTPPANYNGAFDIAVTATSVENATSASANASLHVNVTPVADAPILSVQAVVANEDDIIPLHITVASSDNDPGQVLSVVISGLPGPVNLSAGVHNADGTWTLTPADLINLTMSTPAHWSGTMVLGVTAIASENGTSATTFANLPLSISGNAAPPVLTVHDASGLEDGHIPLSISATLTDPSESLSILIGGVPNGATLSAGVDNHNGTWSLTATDLIGLTFTPPANASGNFLLQVYTTATVNGDSSHAVGTVNVAIAGVADTPTLSVQSASGSEDHAIALTINAALVDLDNSETLTINLSGMPAGTILSAGTHNSDGSWTLTPGQLSGLTLTPPANYNGTIDITVVATSAEDNTAAQASATLHVAVAGVADAPLLAVTDSTGNEDTAIALHINPTLVDTNGVLSIVISGVGTATLSAGTNNHNGTWTLTAAQLTGLTITPPANYSGDLHLGVAVTSTENGTSAAISGNITVHVAGVADAPTLSVQTATGNEDTAIPLTINAALTDTDGSETLAITITGVPNGATLSHGTHNSDGSWSLTQGDLAGLTLTPAANYNGNINLTITATASENGTIASASAPLQVHVNGVADAPILSVVSATCLEDTSVALHITPALVDLNGTLSVTITGIPADAHLSAGTHNGDGSWTLTSAQLVGLTLTPPANYSGDLTLTVTATSTENGTSASISATLPVHVIGVADLPSLSVVANVTVLENVPVPLTIAAGLTDISEHLGIMISGIPSGAHLSAGLNNGDGSWTLTPTQLIGLTLTPANGWSGNLALNVSAISTEDNGDHAAITASINVHVTPVASVPLLNVTAAIGNEGTAIALPIVAGLLDTDGSESLSVKITGLPVGATLSAGVHNSDNSWTLTAAQLVNLRVTLPTHSDGSFNLTVTATATESNGSVANHVAVLPVTVHAVADVPSLSVVNNVVGAAGAQLALGISGALTDTDGSETLSYIVHGIPAGFALNHGCNNGDNSWTLTPGDLANLKLITPDAFNGQLHLHVEAVSYETGNGNSCASAPADILIKVGSWLTGLNIDLGIDAHVGGIGVGVGVGVDLFPANGGLLQASIHVKEDTAFVISDAAQILNLSVLNGVTNLIANIKCTGVPAEITFNHGTHNSDGSWTFSVTDLIGLQMTPANNYSGDFNMTMTANMLLGILPITLVNALPVHVMGIADLPTLSVSAASHVSEDAGLSLNIIGARTDTDGSETLSYLVSGLPAGFMLNHGTCNSNGTWSLTAADVAGLVITPTEHYNGAVHATISAISTESSGSQSVTQQALNFTVDATVHAPILSLHDVSVSEDTSVALNLSAALQTNDGSEHLSALTISGLAAGATLTNATDNHNGTWSVDLAHINDVHLNAASHWSGDMSLTVSATSQVGAGATASSTGTLGIHVEAVAQAPIITVANSSGYDDAPIALHLTATQPDTDGSEHLSVIISGVPDGAVLSAGINNGNGSWSLEKDWLDHLTVTAPANFTGDMHLHMAAWNTEASNNNMASVQQDFAVHVDHHG